ncbi:MAG: palindromic element RPE4 domain-containing protein [Rickettsia endosymbiont of Ecitomorpha arachnoides]|nr:palindromic element RPE4 domain-containing protein [Rickettsia endosymbiont of Ecitomorpha arachnoides]
MLLVFLIVFLDTVVKPRYDTERVSRAIQQC